MDTFNVGERVVVQYGQRQGEQGHVVGRQEAEVYEVRLDSGETLFFGGASLAAPARRALAGRHAASLGPTALIGRAERPGVATG